MIMPCILNPDEHALYALRVNGREFSKRRDTAFSRTRQPLIWCKLAISEFLSRVAAVREGR